MPQMLGNVLYILGAALRPRNSPRWDASQRASVGRPASVAAGFRSCPKTRTLPHLACWGALMNTVTLRRCACGPVD